MNDIESCQGPVLGTLIRYHRTRLDLETYLRGLYSFNCVISHSGQILHNFAQHFPLRRGPFEPSNQTFMYRGNSSTKSFFIFYILRTSSFKSVIICSVRASSSDGVHVGCTEFRGRAKVTVINDSLKHFRATRDCGSAFLSSSHSSSPVFICQCTLKT